MTVIVGYWKDLGTGAGGGWQVKPVPFLKEVGLTASNGKFAVVGSGKEIKTWVKENGNLKVKNGVEGLKEFYVMVAPLTTSNAGKVLMEAYATNLATTGGLAGAAVDALAGTVIGELVNKLGPKTAALSISNSKPRVKCHTFNFTDDGITLCVVANQIGLA